MRVLRVTVAGALVLFAVTAAFGMSVKSDYEKNFDFSQLHTFAFKTDRASNDPLSTNTLEAGRIQSALTAQLEANGFTQATGSPDFIVAFYSRSKQKSQVQSTGGGFGPGLGGGFGRFGYGRGFGWGYGIPGAGRWRYGFGPDIWTTNYTQGCVMADVIDARTNDLVWRGKVTDTIKGVGQSEKQTDQASKDLVSKFVKDAKKVDKSLAKKGA
ncbi:MAG: hypothetical protein QOH71_1978 [Blastocatellia bacterium]|jgi:hypothetical protein|nr:hypothetical protein [Blastocatellia bacterium]